MTVNKCETVLKEQDKSSLKSHLLFICFLEINNPRLPHAKNEVDTRGAHLSPRQNPDREHSPQTAGARVRF